MLHSLIRKSQILVLLGSMAKIGNAGLERVSMSVDEGGQSTDTGNTPLLAARNDHPYHSGDNSPEETLLGDEEENDGENNFDIVKSKLTGYGIALGIEPETQDSTLQPRERKQSETSSHRSARDEESSLLGNTPTATPKSSYLGGVSTRRF